MAGWSSRGHPAPAPPPRDRGRVRDTKLRQLRWSVEGRGYHLEQSDCDAQLWLLRSDDSPTELRGIVVVYVDDFLVVSEGGPVRDGLEAAPRTLWELGPESRLEVASL